MNKKRIWLAIPAALLPYAALFTLATIFLSTKFDFFEMTMESVFDGNGLYLLLAFFLYCMLATALGAVGFIVGICKKWDAVSLAKFAMIVKLIQIPAYLVIFVLGVLLMITIFTFPFAIGLYFLNCLSLFLSGMWVIAAAINALRQGICKPQEVVWTIIFQFVFCADVIAAIVFYIKLKNKQKSDKAPKDSD